MSSKLMRNRALVFAAVVGLALAGCTARETDAPRPEPDTLPPRTDAPPRENHKSPPDHAVPGEPTAPTPTPATPTAPQPVHLRLLGEGAIGGHWNESRLVLRSTGEWESWWANHTSGGESRGPRPDVNFSSELVLIATKGWSSNRCHGIAFSDAHRDGANLVVRVEEYYRGTVCQQQISFPYAIAAAPAAAEVTFEEQPLE